MSAFIPLFNACDTVYCTISTYMYSIHAGVRSVFTFILIAAVS
jgi:hypothetical protein